MQALADIHHPTLGHLSGASGVFAGRIFLGERIIEVSMDPDGKNTESVLALAEAMAQNLSALVEKGLGFAAAELLDSYNSNWRFGTEVQADGSTQDFEHPELSESEFCAALTLSDIQVTGDELVSFTFDCAEMFWGHVIHITSFDALTFSDVQVELQG